MDDQGRRKKDKKDEKSVWAIAIDVPAMPGESERAGNDCKDKEDEDPALTW